MQFQDVTLLRWQRTCWLFSVELLRNILNVGVYCIKCMENFSFLCSKTKVQTVCTPQRKSFSAKLFWGSSIRILIPCFKQIEDLKCIISFSFLRFYLFKREREREKEKQTHHWAGSLKQYSIPGHWDHVLSWRQMLNWLSHPSAIKCILSNCLVTGDR